MMNFKTDRVEIDKMASARTYKCTKCKHYFSIHLQVNTVTGRVPLILPCSHPICEDCVLHMVKRGEVTCDRCKYSFQVDGDDSVLRNVFPMDRYMFGALFHHAISNALFKPTFGPKASVLNGNITPAGGALKVNKKREQPRKLVPKEIVKDACSQQDCHKRADFRCVNCGELYCTKCDKRVHESIKILRNHTRYPIHIADLADFNECCVAHTHKVADYMCETCENGMFCSKCIIQDHQGHTFASVEDINRKEMPQFVEVMDKAKYVLKSMEHTRNKIKTELASCRQPHRPAPAEHDIVQHFAYLHSRLQLLEEQMLSDLHRAQSSRADALGRVLQELEDNIGIMTPLMATGQMVVNKPEHLDKLILGQLHRHVVDNLTLPCELDEVDKDEPSIEFEVDDSFQDVLATHCRINVTETAGCKLSPVTEFTNVKFLISDDSESIGSTDTDVSSMRSSSAVSDAHSHAHSNRQRRSSADPSRHVPPLKKAELCKDSEAPVVFVEGTKESVKVTHLISPSFFYVQLARKQQEITKLTEKYELSAQYAATPTDPELGKTYLVQYIHKDFKKWYRASIKAKVTEEIYEVFYIDYGNSEHVPVDRIREIKPIFMQSPPYAYRCRIGGLVPTKNDWTDDVLQYMVLFFTGKNHLHIDMDELSAYLIYENRGHHLDMVVERSHKGIIDVDLIMNGSSLIAGLLFTGHATNIAARTPQPPQNCMKSLKQKRIMPTLGNYIKDQVYSVFVTHILSPQHLYVQKADNKRIVEGIEQDLTIAYNKEKTSNTKLIFTPEIGMNCAARLSFDDRWHRVLVLDLPGTAQVEVLALDYGITEVIPWNQLRWLNEYFMKTDAQAVKVSLVDIAPVNGGEWTAEVVEYLRKYTNNTVLKMHVKATSKDHLGVTLYETEPDKDICINALLVREGLAESTGDSSLLVEFHNLPGTTGIRKTSDNYAEKLICSIQTYDKEKTEEKQGMDGFTARKHHEQVEILQIESPSSFYVTAIKWADEKRRFHRKLTKFYAELVASDNNWTVGDVCVVNSMKDRNFYRAIVKNVLDNAQFEVFLKDIVRTETVPATNMFELDPKYNHPDFSIHCCLAGVQPTGGTTKWPAIAVEYFNELMNKYSQLSMTKMGRIVDKILPVNLVAFIEENNGPLEPSTIKTVVLNKCLLDKGLALPQKVELDDESTDTTTDTENENEFLASIKKAKARKAAAMSPNNSDKQSIFSDDIIPNKPENTAWPPPERIMKDHFKAWPMYVDHNGHIYLQTERSRQMLTNIKRCMRHFEKTSPDPPHGWVPGQICSVQYHLDNAFCRGQVLKSIAEDKWLVKLVDYGNEEECTHDELRSATLLTDVPIVATECTLVGVVSPDAEWPLAILDKLHFTIVDKECMVTVVEPPTAEQPMKVQLHWNNVCINSEVMNWDWQQTEVSPLVNDTQVSDDNDVVIEDVIEIVNHDDDGDDDSDNLEEQVSDIASIHDILSQQPNTYTRMAIPEDMITFQAMVINVLDYKHVVIEPGFLADNLRQTEERFEELLRDINASAAEQAAVECFTEGTPCAGLFSQDKRWYRAEIYETPDENASKVKVMFVDYGNLEMVAKENLKQMKSEWIDFPVLMLKCKIWGITKAETEDESTVSSVLADILYDKQHVCQIKSMNPELEVKFIDPESYEVVYKDAIDRGILISID